MSETLHNMELRSPQGPGRGRILTCLGLTVLVVILPLVVRTTLYTSEGVSRNAYLTALILPILSLLAAAAGTLVFRRTLGNRLLDIVWIRRDRVELAGTLLLVITVPIVHGLVSSLFRRFGLATAADCGFYAGGLGLAFFLAVTIFTVAVTPIIEELFWRGTVQSMLTHTAGAASAWIVQAALFAGVHLRPLGGFLSLFAFGLMTGLWRWRRRTLLPVILVHIVVNSLWCAGQWPDWLEMCRIKVTHDYTADLIDLSRPEFYDPNDDARHDYERARRLFQSIPDELDEIVTQEPSGWTPQQRDAVCRWIDANTQALEHLARGAGKSYYRPNYRMEKVHLPALAAARSLAFALNARIRLHAVEGREEEMVRDIVTLYRFGTHFGGGKVLVHQLVGAAICGMTSTTARKPLAHHSFSTHTLDTLRKEFQAFSDADDDVIDFSPERLFCLNEIQKIFTDDGHGHGHAVEAALEASPGMTAQLKEAFLKLERHETTQSVEAFFERIRIAARKSPWELHDEPNGVTLTLQDLMHQNAFLDVIGPAYVRAMEIGWRAKTELDAVLAVFAAHRYEVEHGRLPESLGELVAAGYLEGVPRDGFGPGPLAYRRIDDSFLLYSYGRDFDDDNGTPSKWGAGEQGGDQVFWPVEDYR